MMLQARLQAYVVLKAAHEDRVPGQFAHVAGTEAPDLSGNAVLLHQSFLREGGRERGREGGMEGN